MVWLSFIGFVLGLVGILLLTFSFVYRKIRKAKCEATKGAEFIPPALPFLLGSSAIWGGTFLTLLGAGGSAAAYKLGKGITPFSLLVGAKTTMSGEVTLSASAALLTVDPDQQTRKTVILTRAGSVEDGFHYFDGQDRTYWTVMGQPKFVEALSTSTSYRLSDKPGDKKRQSETLWDNRYYGKLGTTQFGSWPSASRRCDPHASATHTG